MRKKNNTNVLLILLPIIGLIIWYYKKATNKKPLKTAKIIVGDPVGKNISDTDKTNYRTPDIIADPVKAAVISENPLTRTPRDIVEQTIATTGGIKPVKTRDVDLGMIDFRG